uniref:Putative toxin-antitoxin system toxin component, PIN family n=1 Tax=Candidatus Kentrum eta TaxID=2126337 RepID=A0A450UR46_9GAMM|nr:MAG: putative toxin-antitoxin system toxin component, PIN family [Candidatus Kentron sp. H]VFJ88747.1 MAG: putative toxin-antitoxin system toxin component, PIN family [Candidatus Kentron sp. H]VFJ95009.1 MAG: putative toxin-antitoxin system toxin component, PIN family [Candidatus Kentron sp. H]
MRVVFDTNTVISALLFGGSLDWLVAHWQNGLVTPLVSRETAEEFLRVLSYSKFGLSGEKIDALASRYLPFAERIETIINNPDLPRCRDIHDQKFIDLAISGHADVPVR